jgi:hypothetical protein
MVSLYTSRVSCVGDEDDEGEGGDGEAEEQRSRGEKIITMNYGLLTMD